MAITDEMVCFAVYAAARATTQAYRSLLEPWDLTYAQYLVLVLLWNEGDQTVTSLGERMQLDSGTLSPLLRRMAAAGLVTRVRRERDQRVVTIVATPRAHALRTELSALPATIAAGTGLPDQAAAAALIETLRHLNQSMRRAGTEPIVRDDATDEKKDDE